MAFMTKKIYDSPFLAEVASDSQAAKDIVDSAVLSHKHIRATLVEARRLMEFVGDAERYRALGSFFSELERQAK